MKTRILLSVYLALLAAASVSAQTKTSGTLKCSKPEPRYSVEVGDRPGHVIVLEKTACTWTEPQVMGSDKTKDGYSVATVDITATRASGSGTHVSTLESGDKIFVAYRYTTPLKDSKGGDTHGTWSYTGGTGKLKGIKGGGTFKTTFGEDGTTTQTEGQYELPQTGAAAKK